ncbi:potassium channel family protein [Streptomyces sp. NPDC002463]|uniref:potassium channel family protein n=1 Tax=Streptomyces sp. NPDC002463 TaxID=3364645 RepID=UPI00368833BD
MLTASGLVAAYYLLPLDKPFDAATAVGLVLGLLLVSALIAWQTRSIIHSPYPRLKAIEALATTLPFFILLFATAYFLMARSQSGSFTESLSRTDAVYFTVTVFSTVGFGDITPKSEGARVAVLLQMLGNLTLLGVAARVILGAVDVGLGRREQPALTPRTAPSGDDGGADEGTP